MKKFFIFVICIIFAAGSFAFVSDNAFAAEAITLFDNAFGPGRNNSKDNFLASDCTIQDSPSQPYAPGSGYTSMRVNIDGSFVLESKFDNSIDVSDPAYTFISFYLYVTDLDIFRKADSAQLELTSSGECDVEESSIELNTPSFYNILEEGKWNFIYLYFKNIPDGQMNYSNFNYIRIYAVGDDIPKATLFLCNFKVKTNDNGGGSVVKNAEVRTWPLIDPDADELVKQEPEWPPIYEVVNPVIDEDAIYETNTDIYLPVPVIEDLANGKFYTTNYKLSINGPNNFTSSDSFINVSVPGTYIVYWEAYNPDTGEILRSSSYNVIVVLAENSDDELIQIPKDTIPPVMDITNIASVQILKRIIDLTPKEINDNETDPENLLLIIKVTAPNGVTETLIKRDYAPQMEGKYIVNYYLRDLQGNYTELNTVFTVGDPNKTYSTDNWMYLYIGLGAAGFVAISTLIIKAIVLNKKQNKKDY